MNVVEHPVGIFAQQSQMGDLEGARRDGIQLGRNHINDIFCHFGGQTPAQRDVKPEFFHHIGISPRHKVALLRVAQTRRPATFQFSLGCRRAQRIERAHSIGGQFGQLTGFALRRERQKMPQTRQSQTGGFGGGLFYAKRVECGNQLRLTGAVCQAHRRFDCRMKPVFTRGLRDAGDIQITFGMCYTAPQGRVPAQPSRSKISQSARIWAPVNRIA